MFGFRPDGRRVKPHDPIMRLIPYIMTRRSDSQVFTTQYVDAEILSQYINKKRQEGIKISHMSIIVAAWLRTVCEVPMLNRFVKGGDVYARNELALSFVTIKDRGMDELRESVAKLYFDPTQTIFEVSEKIDRAIEKCRASTENSMVNRLANSLLSIPFLTPLLVGVLKAMDVIGLMPKAVIDASPFHTSLFISNMASIKMNSIYHHIYDFGTTSVFFGVGRKTIRITAASEGKIKTQHVYPVGCVIDERIMSGAQFGVAFSVLNKYLRHPELLEERPEKVLFDGVDFSLKEKHKNKM